MLPIVVLITFATTVLADNYCALNCTNAHGDPIPHTVCVRRPPCNPAPACGPQPRPLTTTKEVRAWFLHRHNQYRNRVARGVVRFKGRTLKAANMRELEWDEELEYTAKCWVNACEGWHDFCRRTERFNVTVGQNRFDRIVGEDDEVIDERDDVFKAIDNWYNEARHLNETLIKRYEPDVASQGAQLLWARTTHIGCARIEYTVEEQRRRTTICNYGPGGNVKGSAVFLIGEPCSKCDRKTCCDGEFDALCVAKNVASCEKLKSTVFIIIIIATVVWL